MDIDFKGKDKTMWGAIAAIVLWLISYFLKEGEDEEKDESTRQLAENDAWDFFGEGGLDWTKLAGILGLGYMTNPEGMDKLTDAIADGASAMVEDVGETVVTIFDSLWSTVKKIYENPLAWVATAAALWWFLLREDEEDEDVYVTEEGVVEEDVVTEELVEDGEYSYTSKEPQKRPVNQPTPSKQTDAGVASGKETVVEGDWSDFDKMEATGDESRENLEAWGMDGGTIVGGQDEDVPPPPDEIEVDDAGVDFEDDSDFDMSEIEADDDGQWNFDLDDPSYEGVADADTVDASSDISITFDEDAAADDTYFA